MPAGDGSANYRDPGPPLVPKPPLTLPQQQSLIQIYQAVTAGCHAREMHDPQVDVCWEVYSQQISIDVNFGRPGTRVAIHSQVPARERPDPNALADAVLRSVLGCEEELLAQLYQDVRGPC